MRTYIVYDSSGNEVGYWRGVGHNAAEAVAQKKYGPRASVTYTELGKEFDHIKGGFFTDADARYVQVESQRKTPQTRPGL